MHILQMRHLKTFEQGPYPLKINFQTHLTSLGDEQSIFNLESYLLFVS